MAKEKKDLRIQLVVGQSDIQAIDDWRRKQQDIPSRSEAIRRLIWKGMGKSSGYSLNNV